MSFGEFVFLIVVMVGVPGLILAMCAPADEGYMSYMVSGRISNQTREKYETKERRK